MGENNRFTKKETVVIILITLALLISTVGLWVTQNRSKKANEDVKEVTSSTYSTEEKTGEDSNEDFNSAVITMKNKKLLDNIDERIQEVYDSNGLMFVNFDKESKDSCSIVLRETGEAYMEYGKQITLFLNNGKAINFTKPISISSEGIPLEVLKGCINVVARGYGSVERGTDNNEEYTLMTLDSVDQIVKAYDYVSTDYGWGVMTGYGIKDSDSVKMKVYLYDKITDTSESETKPESEYSADSWCEFRCECIFEINNTSYSAWWMTGSQKLDGVFEIDDNIYNYDENTSTKKWEESLKIVTDSVKELLK